MDMRFSFLPAEAKYYDDFERGSDNLVVIAGELQNALQNLENIDSQFQKIYDLEQKGDEIVHDVFNMLPRTLITPIDMEDIMRLTSAIDDAVDIVEEVASRLQIYHISQAKQPALEFASLIIESAQGLNAAVHGLRDKKSYSQVHENIVQINTIENNADLVLRKALSDLMAERGDPFEFIAWKEILELLELVTDKIEDAGDVIQRVMIANA